MATPNPETKRFLAYGEAYLAAEKTMGGFVTALPEPPPTNPGAGAAKTQTSRETKNGPKKQSPESIARAKAQSGNPNKLKTKA